ncbi:dual specificity protein phosphatase 22 isoform X3 [Marmota marmota marmota]|uniref:dual specificity protein phosphatase 22 isoform X3 n=1 Tax=Marmota marmota marmota TaxID=9994 RepID=UPI002092D04C|nr:dual specificity protein phosphatase 22 isoform X3 [Marmota marmota marmota]
MFGTQGAFQCSRGMGLGMPCHSITEWGTQSTVGIDAVSPPVLGFRTGLTRILPGLYIGNFKDARDAEQLSKNKVTHILSVHDSARPMLEGVKYLCIPAADSPSQNLTRHFKESIKFIHECRLQGEGCLVHCLAGVSRSVTLVIAYIMTVTDFGWEDALHTVRAGRSCANPNLGFQRQLQEFEKHEVHQYRQWLKEEYGENPLRDAEEAKNILATPGILKYWAFLRRL